MSEYPAIVSRFLLFGDGDFILGTENIKPSVVDKTIGFWFNWGSNYSLDRMVLKINMWGVKRVESEKTLDIDQKVFFKVVFEDFLE